MNKGDLVVFKNPIGATIQGRINNIYKNICAAVELPTRESMVVSLDKLTKINGPKSGDKVRFHDRGKHKQGTVENVINNDVAKVIVDDETFYVRVLDLIII